MTAAGYEIVRYREDLAGEVAALRALVPPLRSGAEAETMLRWKYDRNPYLPERLIYVALHSGMPVAMRGAFGSFWETPGGRLVIPCASDLVIAPEHRNHGLVAALTRAAAVELKERGFPCLFSLSAGEVTAISALATGFKIVAPVEWRLRKDRLSPARFLKNRPKFFDFDRKMERGAHTKSLALSRDPRPEAMADLIVRLGGEGPIRHVRDAAYLTWRYQNPVAEHRFIYSGASAGGDRLNGYVALAAQNLPSAPVYILDWEAESEVIKHSLLRAALRLGRFRRTVAWGFGMSEAERRMMDAEHLRANRQQGVRHLGLNVMVLPLATDSAALMRAGVLDAAQWQYRKLYSEYN